MWKYRGKWINSHEDLHPDCTDFVYVIEYSNQKKYIGKKAVRAIRRKPPLKGKKRNRLIMTNLPFVKYQGSFDGAELLTPISKLIVFQCSKRKASTYLEMELMVEHMVIFEPEYINENIAGTFFKDSLDGLLDG